MAGWSLGLAIFGCAWAVVGVVILATGVLGSVQLPLDPAGDDGAPGRDGPTGRTTACADVRVGDC
jgi:hypothetical protein